MYSPIDRASSTTVLPVRPLYLLCQVGFPGLERRPEPLSKPDRPPVGGTWAKSANIKTRSTRVHGKKCLSGKRHPISSDHIFLVLGGRKALKMLCVFVFSRVTGEPSRLPGIGQEKLGGEEMTWVTQRTTLAFGLMYIFPCKRSELCHAGLLG